LVKNLSETNRIMERNGRIIQKIYPVYKKPDPDHLVDFNAQFYMPFKHFLNTDLDTYYFNMGVIWFMTLVLMATLYFDVLRRLLQGMERIPAKFENR